MSAKPTIVWFRQDLRLRDHPALTAAVKSGAPIIPLYVLDDAAAGRWKSGGASRWWLAKSLEALGHDIAERGSRLILRRGDTAKILKRIVEESGASAVYVTRGYEPWAVALETKVHKLFERSDVVFKRFGGRLLREPEDLCTTSGAAYQVFTPFWRAFRRDFKPPKALAAPARFAPVPKEIASDRISDWRLMPTTPDWSGGLVQTWRPGEHGAQARLEAFVAADLPNYVAGRDRLDIDGTSRLSPHLAFGEISPSA